MHAELLQDGFNGEILAANLDSAANPTIIEVYDSVISELVTHIMKYSDRTYPYAITMQPTNDTFVLQHLFEWFTGASL